MAGEPRIVPRELFHEDDILNMSADELEEALSEPEWRINNLYYIVDEYGQKIMFKLNEIQQRISKCYAKKRNILKYRQG